MCQQASSKPPKVGKHVSIGAAYYSYQLWPIDYEYGQLHRSSSTTHMRIAESKQQIHTQKVNSIM